MTGAMTPGLDPETAVAAYFAGVNEDRFDAVAALFVAEGELRAPGTPPRQGREAIAAYLAGALRHYPEHVDTPTRVLVAQRSATVEIRFDGALASGVKIGFDAVDIFDFAPDGLIERLSSWYDSAAVLRSLRLGREAGSTQSRPAG